MAPTASACETRPICHPDSCQDTASASCGSTPWLRAAPATTRRTFSRSRSGCSHMVVGALPPAFLRTTGISIRCPTSSAPSLPRWLCETISAVHAWNWTARPETVSPGSTTYDSSVRPDGSRSWSAWAGVARLDSMLPASTRPAAHRASRRNGPGDRAVRGCGGTGLLLVTSAAPEGPRPAGGKRANEQSTLATGGRGTRTAAGPGVSPRPRPPRVGAPVRGRSAATVEGAELELGSLDGLLVGGAHRPVAHPVHLHPGRVHGLALLRAQLELQLPRHRVERLVAALGVDHVGVDEPGDVVLGDLDGVRVPAVVAQVAAEEPAVGAVGERVDVGLHGVGAEREVLDADVAAAAVLITGAAGHQLGDDLERLAALDLRHGAGAHPDLPATVGVALEVEGGRHAAALGAHQGEHAVLGADDAAALLLPEARLGADELLAEHAVLVPAERVAGVDRAGCAVVVVGRGGGHDRGERERQQAHEGCCECGSEGVHPRHGTDHPPG